MTTNSATPAKSFVCHRCSRGFARLEHLQRHERSHTKEKPFRCPRCQKGFTRKDLLTRHIRLSHQSPPETRSQQSHVPSRPETLLPAPLPLASWTDYHSGPGPVLSSQPHVVPPATQSLVSNTRADQQHIDQVHLSARFYGHPNDENSSHGSKEPFTAPVPDYSMNLGLDDGGFDALESAYTQDFATFMDSVPNLTHPFSPTYQPLPVFFTNLDLPLAGVFDNTNDLRDGENSRDETTATTTIQATPTSLSNIRAADSSISRFGSRLPSLAPEDKPPPTGPHPQGPTRLNSRDLFISAVCRQHIIDELATFSGCIDGDFVLPSRHALSRLIGGYFKNFHAHYPFFHVATLQMDGIHVELLLAIAALGARYTREPEMGVELFRVSRAIVLERLRRRQKRKANMVLGQRAQDNFTVNPDSNWKGDERFCVVEMVQTLLLLIAIASWYRREPAVTDALSIRSVLHSLIQDDEISQTQEQPTGDWQEWVRFETIKRTHLVVFCFFNIHTILFDLPPMMLASGLRLDLPCSEKEWKAGNELDWRDARAESRSPRQDFQDAFSCLFANPGEWNGSTQIVARGFSALGGCALIHAIIQHIWLARNARLPIVQGSSSSLSDEEMNVFERALKRWAKYWERNQESSMDPLSPHGPVTFTSTALLRLAYIRLNMDLGPVRSLSSWDPEVVANSLHQSPKVQRSDKMTRAALHCAHALSIPVKLGINYVAQTQLILWSNQHALCSLECAVLLAKWLEAVTVPDSSPALTAPEQRVLEFVVQLVAETEYKMSCDRILTQKARLSGMVVRLWAKLYQSSSVWQMVNLIGESLSIYADLLEAEHKRDTRR
ncbi:uncharacterized protein PV07_11982 [Cladophialophora immunda]|uniref:C2H2-type domain-containing protein n=1 Tax=Cladophialophora immunda TaxID=569365 RepID=A0A0D2BXG1_9EURO|nr:uncharacterized protein PV07_11982 [Cladophialophora immunda]KIW23813.1 hypothetical protein PV07_11982 [Cladophialophora immunda]OQU95495.1 Fungal specific transcription factor domain-containing protein [Cladophialophora immunda]